MKNWKKERNLKKELYKKPFTERHLQNDIYRKTVTERHLQKDIYRKTLTERHSQKYKKIKIHKNRSTNKNTQR